MGHFLAQQHERLLANQLGHHEAGLDIGDLVLGIVAGTHRQQAAHARHKLGHARAAQAAGNLHDEGMARGLHPRDQGAVGGGVFLTRARGLISLVERKHQRSNGRARVNALEQLGNVLVFVGGGRAAIHQPEHHVGVGNCLLGHTHHVLAQLVQRSVDAGGVEKEDLRVGHCDNAQNLVARRLRLGGDNGQFLPQQAVEQRGFAHIGAADYGHIAAAVVGGQFALLGQQTHIHEVCLKQ